MNTFNAVRRAEWTLAAAALDALPALKKANDPDLDHLIRRIEALEAARKAHDARLDRIAS